MNRISSSVFSKSLFVLALSTIFLGANFALAVNPKGQVEESSYSSTTTLPSKSVEFSYTQSMGHLKTLLGDHFVEISSEKPQEGIKANIQKLYQPWRLTDHLGIRTDINHPNVIPIAEALLEEHSSPDRDFAYHGANPHIGLLYDIYSEFRRQLLNIEREDLFMSRGTDQAFVGLQNIADFINEQLRKQNKKSFRNLGNYDADYAEKALSVNLFLFGNCGAAFDDTIKFFITGQSDRDILLKRSLIKFFTYFGIDMTKTEEIGVLISEFESLPLLDRGRLFQFSFAPGTIDEFIYLSKSVGKGVTIDDSEEYDIQKKEVSTLIHNIRKNPLSVLENSKKIRYYDGSIPIEYFDLRSIQGRFFPHPKLFDQNSPIKVRSYWRGLSSNSAEVLNYKQTLKGLVSKIVTLASKSQVTLPKTTLLLGDINKSSVETTKPRISDQLLSAYICSGDLEQLKRGGSIEQIDVNKPIVDINDLEDQTEHSPLYLAVKYNHPEVVEFLLSKEAHVKNEEGDKRNLLGWTCMNGHPDITQKLLDSGCNPNTTFRVRFIPDPVVMIAQKHGHDKVVNVLMDHQDFSPSPKTYKELWISMIENQKGELLKILLRKVDKIDHRKEADSSIPELRDPLGLAISTGNTDLVRIVLENTHPSLEGWPQTPAIIKAIDEKNLPIIKLLIQFGADLHKKYSFYGTPLERAHKTENEEMIAFIEKELEKTEGKHQ